LQRREFIILLGGASLICAPLLSRAQASPKTAVVGVLMSAPDTPISRKTVDVLRKALADLGYIEGKNIVVDVRWTGGTPEMLSRFATELVRRKVDVLYAVGPAAVHAASAATADIPIVGMDLESDPVKAGWARSLGRPGGNVTGLFLDLPGLTGKWLELLREVVPNVRRVALLWDPTTGRSQLAAIQIVAKGLGIELQVLEVRASDDLQGALGTMIRGSSRALVMLSAPLVRSRSQQIAEFTLQNKMPAISPFRTFADFGGLMSYGPEIEDFFRRSAVYADKILKGARAADLPIEQPKTFEFVINLKSAKALGLSVPQSLLVRADEVLQ